MEKKCELTFMLVLSTFICCFGSSMLFGYNIGVINAPTKFIKVFYERIYYERNNENPTEQQVDLFIAILTSIYVAIAMFGSLFSGAITDRLGRKWCLIYNHVLMIIGSVLEGISQPVGVPELVILGRGIIGFNCGITVGVASMYLTEISPKEIRGAIGSCHQLACTLGILIAQVLGLGELFGTQELWPWVLASGGFAAVISAMVFPFCPESPRYLLLKKNDEDGARKALERLRGRTDVQEEIDEMLIERTQLVSSSGQSMSIRELICSKEFRMALVASLVIHMSQQWSGINAVFFYSERIFKAAGIAGSNIGYAIVGTGCVNFFVTIIAVPLVEKLGRRCLLLFPILSMIVSMGILIAVLSFIPAPGEVTDVVLNNTVTSKTDYILLTTTQATPEVASWIGVVAVITIFIYISGFAVGLGPLAWLVVAELFRQDARGSAMAISGVVNWVCALGVGMLFPFMDRAMGPYAFLVFVVVLIFADIFIFFKVPETKNKTFEEIAHEMSGGKISSKGGHSVELLGSSQNKVNEDVEA